MFQSTTLMKETKLNQVMAPVMIIIEPAWLAMHHLIVIYLLIVLPTRWPKKFQRVENYAFVSFFHKVFS